VNKPPGNTPDSSWWHHVHGVNPVEKGKLAREEDTPLSEAQEERNKVLVRRFLEAQAKGDLDAVREMMAAHFVDHHPRNQGSDHREGYLRVVAEEQAAFSDIRYINEDQIAQGDKVMTRWTGSGVHDRGEYQGFAPTGRWSAGKIIDVHRIEGGKIAEEWKGASTLADLQQERLAQVERERVEHLYTFVGEDWEQEDDITLLTLRRSASPS
jgi:predicted ester cyclase